MEDRDQGDPEKDGITTGLLTGNWNYGGDTAAAAAAGGSTRGREEGQKYPGFSLPPALQPPTVPLICCIQLDAGPGKHRLGATAPSPSALHSELGKDGEWVLSTIGMKKNAREP